MREKSEWRIYEIHHTRGSANIQVIKYYGIIRSWSPKRRVKRSVHNSKGVNTHTQDKLEICACIAPRCMRQYYNRFYRRRIRSVHAPMQSRMAYVMHGSSVGYGRWQKTCRTLIHNDNKSILTNIGKWSYISTYALCWYTIVILTRVWWTNTLEDDQRDCIRILMSTIAYSRCSLHLNIMILVFYQWLKFLVLGQRKIGSVILDGGPQ